MLVAPPGALAANALPSATAALRMAEFEYRGSGLLADCCDHLGVDRADHLGLDAPLRQRRQFIPVVWHAPLDTARILSAGAAQI